MTATLPALDILFWCTTDDDLRLAEKMTSQLDADHNAAYLKRNGKGLDVSRLDGFDGDHSQFPSVEAAEKALLTSDRQSAVIKLNDCDVLEDALSRMYASHVAKGASTSEASFYPNFTDAKFTFQDLAQAPLPVNQASHVGPQDRDLNYYLNERFDELFHEPKFLSLDLTRKCNKRCGKCMYHSPDTPHYIPKNESMPKELMRDIIRQASEFESKPDIHPFLSGEPFLYEHLEDFLKTLTEYGLSTSITTNGILLNEQNIDMLFKYNVRGVTISLDSISPEKYKELQYPGHLEKVLRHIDLLLEKRKGTDMTVQLTFVVDHSNESEFDAYFEHWIDKVDTIIKAVKTNNFGDRAPEYPLLTKAKRSQCLLPWLSMCIRPNGAVSLPCAYDLQGIYSLNAGEMSLADIWRSDEYSIWRKRLSEPGNDRAQLFCKSCNDCGSASYEEKNDKYTVTYSPTMAVYQKN